MTLVLVTLKLMFTLPLVMEGDLENLKGDSCVVENVNTYRPPTHTQSGDGQDSFKQTNTHPIFCTPLRVNLGNISPVVIMAKIY